MSKPLMKTELAELSAAGIEYPWSARDMLRMVRLLQQIREHTDKWGWGDTWGDAIENAETIRARLDQVTS